MAGTKINGGTAGCTRVSRSNGFQPKTGGDALSRSAREGFAAVAKVSSRICSDCSGSGGGQESVRMALRSSTPPLSFMDIDTFAIGFDHRDRARVHALWDEVLDV